jgi:cell division protein FtsB
VSAIRASALGQHRLFVLVTLGAAIFVLFFPARQLVQQRERIASIDERLAAARAENEQLSGEVARLSDPSEVELLARERLGLVRPGEEAYYLESAEPPPPRAAPAEPPKSFWSRTWSWLRGLVRGRG